MNREEMSGKALAAILDRLVWLLPKDREFLIKHLNDSKKPEARYRELAQRETK